MSTVYTEEFHAGGYIKSEANGLRSREQVTITGSAKLLAGTVLGKITQGAQSVAAPVAFAGNTGNGAPGTWTAAAGVPAGDYKILIDAAATNAGHFVVFKPDGTIDGEGNVGTAYNGSIKGTIADGATDFAVNDGFTVTVSYAAGSGKYVQHNPANTDGSQTAAAILYADADATSADVQATAHVRDMEYNAAEIIWLTGISGTNRTAGIAALAALGMIGR